jgi:hypothetical protein
MRRAAESLEGAPYLLSALKARGHARLADQIATYATVAPKEALKEPPAVEPLAARRPVRAERRERFKEAIEAPACKRADGKQWLQKLEGDGAFAAAPSKRSKAWLELGDLGGEAALLKVPAASGKPEWVLKRTWPEDDKRKPEYVVAGSFKGIAGFLVDAGVTAADIEGMLAALADVAHPELEAAARAWRSAASTH